MFDFLKEIPEDVAGGVTYFASLFLFDPRWLPEDERDPVRMAEGAIQAVRMSAKPEEVEFTARAFEEIERAEGKRIVDFSREEAGKYISMMSDIMSERRRSAPGYDPGRGQRLLEELRRDYANPSRRRHAA